MKWMISIGAIGMLALCLAQAPKPTLAVTGVPKAVVAGSKVTLKASFAIAPGYHGYQNPPVGEYEIPVTLKVDGKEFKVVKIAYPAGVEAAVGGSEKATKAYEGVIQIPVTILAPVKPGIKDLKITVSYQLCDETSCFPPDQVTKTIKVNVVKKAGKA